MASPAYSSIGALTNISNTSSVPRPTTVATNDRLLMVVVVGYGDANVAIPSGWAVAETIPGTNSSLPELHVFEKLVADGATEPANYAVTISGQGGGNNIGEAVVLSYSGVHTTSPIAAHAWVYNSSPSTSAVCPSISPATTDTTLVNVYLPRTNNVARTWTPPSGMTQRHNAGSNPTGSVIGIADQPISASGATGTRTATLDSSSESFCISIALASASAGSGGTPVSFSGTVGGQSATVGTASTLALAGYFSGTLTPLTYSLQSGALPPGLSLNSSTGVISGTPTTAGTYSGIVVRATDTGSNTASTNAFTFTVSVTTGSFVSSRCRNGAGTLLSGASVSYALHVGAGLADFAALDTFPAQKGTGTLDGNGRLTKGGHTLGAGLLLVRTAGNQLFVEPVTVA